MHFWNRGKGEKYHRRLRGASAQQKSNSPPLPKAEGERGRGETSNALAKGSRNNIRHFRMQQKHFSQKSANIRRIPKYEQKFSALLNFRLRTHVVFANSADKKIEEGMGNYCVCPFRSFCLQIAAKEGGRTIVASRFSKNPIYLLFSPEENKGKSRKGKKALEKKKRKGERGIRKLAIDLSQGRRREEGGETRPLGDRRNRTFLTTVVEVEGDLTCLLFSSPLTFFLFRLALLWSWLLGGKISPNTYGLFWSIQFPPPKYRLTDKLNLFLPCFVDFLSP